MWVVNVILAVYLNSTKNSFANFGNVSVEYGKKSNIRIRFVWLNRLAYASYPYLKTDVIIRCLRSR